MPAPHLPPREVKPERNLKEFLLFVLLVVVLSFSSGAAAAAVAITWVLPPFPAARSIFTFFQNQENESDGYSLTSSEQVAVRQRVVKIYDKRKSLPGGFYEKSGLYGEAVILTVDGWAVLFAPNLGASDMSSLQVVDTDGRGRGVERLLLDPLTGLVYMNIEGEGFPVFALPNTRSIHTEPLWFLKNADFLSTMATFSFSISKDSAQPVLWLQPQINEAFPGVVVVNERGELVGILDKNKSLLSGVEFNRQLRFLQKNGILGTKGFPVTGYVVEGVQTNERGATTRQYGFVITDAGKLKNVLKTQDIMVQIQQKDFSPFSARDDILALSDEFMVTVLRQGKKVEVRVSKT